MWAIGYAETRRWARINDAVDARTAVEDPDWVPPGRTRWSKTELLILTESDLTNAEIADRLGRSEQAVAIQRYRLANGVPPKTRRRRRRW